MLRKIKRSRLREVFSYIRGGDPLDEWEFEIGIKPCRFVNGWRSGAALIVDGEEVARNNQLIAVWGRKPLVTAELKDSDDRQRQVDVYIRAIFGVKIHVRLDDIPVNSGFL